MSDSELVSVLQQAYNGTVNLETDYGWKIGDERKVKLSSFTYKCYNGSYGQTLTRPS